ncbi:MAG: carbonic anhydrase family protein [Paucibacter sp.]|nr:carbonic anhydrase family protein [Roseateles sp.]
MRLMTAACLLATALAIPSRVLASDETPLDYRHQENWVAILNHAQSPIDIVTSAAQPAQADEAGAIVLRQAQAETGTTVDTGHAVRFDTQRTEATIRGRHFRLAQLHFHAPSEHTINGQRYPLEGHFVFRAENGHLAVLAVMYEDGSANHAAQAILDDLATLPQPTEPRMLDLNALLPAQLGYYHYLGSLTTPPLTQNVEW